jgi:hypothetical protein
LIGLLAVVRDCIHTCNVGFWLNAPSEELQGDGATSAPAMTPFNGEQNTAVLTRINRRALLQTIQ